MMVERSTVGRCLRDWTNLARSVQTRLGSGQTVIDVQPPGDHFDDLPPGHPLLQADPLAQVRAHFRTGPAPLGEWVHPLVSKDSGEPWRYRSFDAARAEKWAAPRAPWIGGYERALNGSRTMAA
jgi:hypothetical protein